MVPYDAIAYFKNDVLTKQTCVHLVNLSDTLGLSTKLKAYALGIVRTLQPRTYILLITLPV